MLLTQSEICKELGISQYALCNVSKKIKVTVVGKRKYYDKKSVEVALSQKDEIKFDENTYEIKFHNGNPFVLMSDMATLLRTSPNAIRLRIRRKYRNCIEGVDYFRLPTKEALNEYNIIAPNGLIGIYYSGFKKIIKDDEVSLDLEKVLYGESVIKDSAIETCIPGENVSKIKYYKDRPIITIHEFAVLVGKRDEFIRKRLYSSTSNCIQDIDYVTIPFEEVFSLYKNLVPKGLIGIYHSGFKKINYDNIVSPEIEKELFGDDGFTEDETSGEVISLMPEETECLDSQEANTSLKKLIDALEEERKINKEIIDRQTEQINQLIELIKYTNVRTEAVSIDKNSVHDDIKKETVSQPKSDDSEKNDNVDIPISNHVDKKTWYKRINDLLNDIGSVSALNQNEILCQAYKILNGQYGLCLNQYIKEYRKILGTKPTTLSTIYWVESEKNPATNGLLAGVLDTMLNKYLDEIRNE